MKLTDIKRLTTDDFPKDQAALVSRLAFALNPILEQLSAAFNKNIDFDNLNQEVINVTVEVDGTGTPKTLTDIKSNLRTRVRGLICIRAINLENDGTFPTTSPFVSFTTFGNLTRITNVLGLPPNKRYTLTLISIG
jgi:hypothetical protein